MRLKLLAIASSIVFLSGCVTMEQKGSSAKKDIEVTQTERGALISISEKVLFDSGSSTLRTESKNMMDTLAKTLIEKTKNQISVEGHTDNIGSRELNLKLSENRAETVKRELISRGVPEKRIITKGLGFSSPKADNKTEEGRSLNRRTEVIVLGEKKENLGASLEEMLGNVWLKVKQIFS